MDNLTAEQQKVAIYGGRDWFAAEWCRLEGLHLPSWDEEATPQAMWWWVVRLGIDTDAFLEYTGYERPESLLAHNAGRPLRAWVAEMIEQLDCSPLEIAAMPANEPYVSSLAEQDESMASPAVPGLWTDFADAGWWDKLAEQAGVDLPPWDTQLTEPLVRELLKASRVSVRSYQQQTGDEYLLAFHWRNPKWPARAWAGLVLESAWEGDLKWKTTKTRA